MKRIATTLIGQLILWTLVYFAFYQQLAGAENLLTFWLFACAFASLFAITDKVLEAASKNPPMHWLRWWVIFNGFALLGVLIWVGHFFTAIAVVFIMVMQSTQFSEVKKKRAAQVAG